MTDLARQNQKFAHDPENGIQGDCWRTAIACVLRIDRDDVPHSHEDMTGDEMAEYFGNWLRSQGLLRICLPITGDLAPSATIRNVFPRGSGLPMIFAGEGPRGPNHAIVVFGGKDIWCPFLGAVSPNKALVGPTRPDGHYEAEWIVRAPAHD